MRVRVRDRVKVVKRRELLRCGAGESGIPEALHPGQGCPTSRGSAVPGAGGSGTRPVSENQNWSGKNGKKACERSRIYRLRSLHAKAWRAQLTTAEGLAGLRTGLPGGQSLQLLRRQGTQVSGGQQGWNGGRRGQATLKWGSLASGRMRVKESSGLGSAGDSRSYLVPFDELTPASQGLHHGGRLQLQRVDAGPGARHGQAGGGSGTHGAPTGTDGAAALSTPSRAARSGPAASAPARQPVCPGPTGDSAPGPAPAQLRPVGRCRPLPPRRGPPGPRRRPLAVGAATASRGRMEQIWRVFVGRLSKGFIFQGS